MGTLVDGGIASRAVAVTTAEVVRDVEEVEFSVDVVASMDEMRDVEEVEVEYSVRVEVGRFVDEGNTSRAAAVTKTEEATDGGEEVEYSVDVVGSMEVRTCSVNSERATTV